jgi:hypothetical protein
MSRTIHATEHLPRWFKIITGKSATIKLSHHVPAPNSQNVQNLLDIDRGYLKRRALSLLRG